MKKGKKIFVSAAALALSVSALTAVAAAAYTTPAEALADLTSRTVESVIDEHVNEDKTYGEIANEAGVLEAFREANQEIRITRIEDRVADGTLDRERADTIIERIKENTANCDGTGTAQQNRVGGGKGTGSGTMQRGAGMGGGGLRDGSCL